MTSVLSKVQYACFPPLAFPRSSGTSTPFHPKPKAQLGGGKKRNNGNEFSLPIS
jgi:hypothetical protein